MTALRSLSVTLYVAFMVSIQFIAYASENPESTLVASKYWRCFPLSASSHRSLAPCPCSTGAAAARRAGVPRSAALPAPTCARKVRRELSGMWPFMMTLLPSQVSVAEWNCGVPVGRLGTHNTRPRRRPREAESKPNNSGRPTAKLRKTFKGAGPERRRAQTAQGSRGAGPELRKAQTTQGPDYAGPRLRRAQTTQGPNDKSGERGAFRPASICPSTEKSGQHLRNHDEQVVARPVFLRRDPRRVEVRTQVPDRLFRLAASDFQRAGSIATYSAAETLADVRTYRLHGVSHLRDVQQSTLRRPVDQLVDQPRRPLGGVEQLEVPGWHGTRCHAGRR